MAMLLNTPNLSLAHGTDADEVKSKATEGDSRCQAQTFSNRLKLLHHMICYSRVRRSASQAE
jgi:hypothetical protein